MNFKKISSLIISCFMVLNFTACKNDEPAEDLTETTVEEITSDYISNVDNIETTTVSAVISESTEPFSEKIADNSVTSVTAVKDFSSMSKAEIVEMYKNSAEKSHSSVTSQHAVEITKIAVNGEELGGAFDFIKSIISSFISKNSEDTVGITGGYKNLTESDVASAKIYKSGSNTAVEMVMNNQTDGAKTDAKSGSVGHAIDVVGDINDVANELSELGLPIEISGETTTIHYTNPTVKVLVDGNGKIIKGTWHYTVEIRLKDYKAFGVDVQSSSIVMENVITVNGGF